MSSAQLIPPFGSRKVRSHTGSVMASGRGLSTSANTNSFQAWMNPKMPVATRPGASSGKVILQKAPARLSPSIIAASSRSAGTPLTNPRSVQIVNGSTVAM